MQLIKAESYVVIQGWMITELNLKGNELLIYACIYGFSQKENQVFNGSLQYLSDWTNLSKRNVIERLKALIDRGLIVKTENYVNNTKSCEYRAVYGNGSDETSLPVMNHHQCRNITGGDETSPNNIDIYNISNISNNKSKVSKNTKKPKKPKENKESKEDIYSSIIDYLNLKSGKRYRSTNASTHRMISARLAEGYKLDDFKRVIDTKAAQWSKDKKMSKYLRPETLFAPSHFESYLNEGDENDAENSRSNQPLETGIGWNKIL